MFISNVLSMCMFISGFTAMNKIKFSSKKYHSFCIKPSWLNDLINSSLVAPITINENSVIGAGSVITKNVRKKSLALTRSSQVEIKNYKRKK